MRSGANFNDDPNDSDSEEMEEGSESDADSDGGDNNDDGGEGGSDDESGEDSTGNGDGRNGGLANNTDSRFSGFKRTKKGSDDGSGEDSDDGEGEANGGASVNNTDSRFGGFNRKKKGKSGEDISGDSDGDGDEGSRASANNTDSRFSAFKLDKQRKPTDEAENGGEPQTFDGDFSDFDDEERKPKRRKPGIIYLASIPPTMNVTRVREFFGEFGVIGRVYLQPERGGGAAAKRKRGGKPTRVFTEGWVEFASKRTARRMAEALNNKPVGGRKRSKAYDTLWNIKYLPRFKWTHLNERMEYERAARQQRMRTEISQAKREANFFAKNVERSLAMHLAEKQKQRKLKKKEKKERKKAGAATAGGGHGAAGVSGASAAAGDAQWTVTPAAPTKTERPPILFKQKQTDSEIVASKKGSAGKKEASSSVLSKIFS